LPLTINKKLNYVLLLGQSALPDSQFQAFRKLILDSFGKGENGLGRELDRVFEEQIRTKRLGQGRNILGSKRGVL
jgi:hypothetical protein